MQVWFDVTSAISPEGARVAVGPELVADYFISDRDLPLVYYDTTNAIYYEITVFFSLPRVETVFFPGGFRILFVR